jgi:hypothetical protein
LNVELKSDLSYLRDLLLTESTTLYVIRHYVFEMEFNIETLVNVEPGEQYSEDEEAEFPPDRFFYGELTEKVSNIDELVEIMSRGILKLKNYMRETEKVEVAPEDLVTTLDYWFQHDSERDNYFDYLISEQPNPTSAVLFDKVSQKIIQNVEDVEKIVEDSKSVPKQNTS